MFSSSASDRQVSPGCQNQLWLADSVPLHSPGDHRSRFHALVPSDLRWDSSESLPRSLAPLPPGTLRIEFAAVAALPVNGSTDHSDWRAVAFSLPTQRMSGPPSFSIDAIGCSART